MEEQAFLYDSSITAPLQNPPLWPYTMYFKMPHRCHGNLQNCPTRSHAVWEMVMNELDRREDPTIDEDIAGCAMVDSCSNILSGDQFYNFLTHNFYRHFDQNRAPLGLFFHAAWLKNNPEYLDAFLYWVDEVLESHPEAYFITMTQVIQWIQNPVSVDSAKNYAPWQEKCSRPKDKLFGTKQLQAFNRRARWGVNSDAHLHALSQQVPLAERPHWRRDPVIISSSAEVGPPTPLSRSSVNHWCQDCTLTGIKMPTKF